MVVQESPKRKESGPAGEERPTKTTKGSDALLDGSSLEALLKQYGVAGVSFAVIDGEAVRAQPAGLADRSTGAAMTTSTALEIASLSKPLAAAFALEYFKARSIPMDSKVNPLLREAGCSFQVQSGEGCPPEWAEEITLAHLVNHHGLGMHYVNGVPLSEPMPPVLDLISGTAEKPAPYGYAILRASKKPGSAFGYSGGGFLVLQHLLEMREGKPIAKIMQPFLASSGASVEAGLSFEQDLQDWKYAKGYYNDGGLVKGGRLMFPPLAAGGLGTPAALAEWLRQLAVAYKRPEGCGPISHDSAVTMLTPGPDLGSEAFMKSRMGLGVFVLEAGTPGSKWMLHQAANDGFRGFFLVCFDGPDAADGPRGLVILCNGDNSGMFLNCAVCRLLLQSSSVFKQQLSGIDWNKVPPIDNFTIDGLKQEEIVNLGFKELVLNAFVC
jgi:CubicO group peptidase (beta-lactamase class C family)